MGLFLSIRKLLNCEQVFGAVGLKNKCILKYKFNSIFLCVCEIMCID